MISPVQRPIGRFNLLQVRGECKDVDIRIIVCLENKVCVDMVVGPSKHCERLSSKDLVGFRQIREKEKVTILVSFSLSRLVLDNSDFAR